MARTRRDLLAVILVLTLCLSFVVSMVVQHYWPFMPAAQVKSNPLWLIPWILTACLTIITFYRDRSPFFNIKNRWLNFLANFGGGCFGFLVVGYVLESFFRVSIPMLHAGFIMEAVEFSYILEDSEKALGGGYNALPNCADDYELTVRFAPLSQNICTSDNELLQRSKPGDLIVLKGKGSSAGVFYERVELGESNDR